MSFIVGKCYEFFDAGEQATITIQVVSIDTKNKTVTGRICGTTKNMTFSISKLSKLKEVGCTNCG